jgi:hypothetical protein
MKTGTETIRLILYDLPERHLASLNLHGVRTASSWKRPQYSPSRCVRDLLVTLSNSLDDSFIHAFHAKATPQTRLLVLNHCLSSDSLVSRFIDLQIRSPERFYVAELNCDIKLEQQWEAVHALLSRLTTAVKAKDRSYRILDAGVEDGCLRVVSPDFRRLEVPLVQIPALSKINASEVKKFEIDRDGSFIYWSDFDIHLGWQQLEQIVNPEVMRKALQRNKEFNVRYGAAIRRVREEASIATKAIPGLSEKQLRRIERGECRATSNALQRLAKAHGLKPNDYLERIAEALG